MARLAKDVAASFDSTAPSGPFVRFEGNEAGRLIFAVRDATGHIELMSFYVHITADGSGSAVNTRIEEFTTARSTCPFPPLATTTMVGYGEYKMFARRFGEALRRADPRSHRALVEKPLW